VAGCGALKRPPLALLLLHLALMPPRQAAAAAPADAAASCPVGACSRCRPRPALLTAEVLAGLLAALLAFGCRQGAPPPAAARDEQRRPPAAAEGGGYPRVHIRNVHMMFDPEVVLEVRELYGRMQPTRRGEIPFFDDPTSFRIEIDGATTAISTASMAALLNHFTFAYPGAPLKGLTIEPRDGKLLQKGTLHKQVDVPFEMTGELSLRPDGRLRLHPTAIKVAGIPAKGLLDALGLELVKLIKVREDRGVAIEGDDLLLDANRLMPPPAVSGRIRSACLEGDRIVLEFGGDRRPERLEPPIAVPNYLYFKGGRLRFGKLTMHDTDLLLVDAQPADPFRFHLAQYARQLVAGYSRTMPNQGLVTFMPDADKIGRPLVPPPAGGREPGTAR